MKEVAPFVALVAILTFKPYGLFGKVKIERVREVRMRRGDFRESYAEDMAIFESPVSRWLLAASRRQPRPPTGSTSSYACSSP